MLGVGDGLARGVPVKSGGDGDEGFKAFAVQAELALQVAYVEFYGLFLGEGGGYFEAVPVLVAFGVRVDAHVKIVLCGSDL